MIVLIKAFGLPAWVGRLGGPDRAARMPPFIRRHIDALTAGVASPSFIDRRPLRTGFTWHLMRPLRRRFRRQMLIVGSDREAERIADCIIRQKRNVLDRRHGERVRGLRLNSAVAETEPGPDRRVGGDWSPATTSRKSSSRMRPSPKPI